jgi:GMP synthase-like glutamine amidotransferase
MRVLVIEHEHDGGAGLVAERLAERGASIDSLRVMRLGSTHSDVVYPDPTAVDMVVAMGSRSGVYETERIGSWIDREIGFVRAAHDAGVPVLGICFGAQVLTAALGGTVEPAPRAEIGWYVYESIRPDVVSPGPWFTWHGDRCVLPEGAGVELLASNDLCPQAFRALRSVGVQFHPEVDRTVVARWAANCPPSYFADRGADPAAFLDGFERHGAGAAANCTTLVDWFVDEVANG